MERPSPRGAFCLTASVTKDKLASYCVKWYATSIDNLVQRFDTMHMIHFLLMFAELQAERGGRAVSVSYIMSQCNLSRSTIHRRLNQLIKSKVLIKPKRGKYYINRNTATQSIGFCVNTVFDHMEFETRNSIKDWGK